MKNKYLNIFQNFFATKVKLLWALFARKNKIHDHALTRFFDITKNSSVVLFCVGMRKNVHTFLPTRLIQFSRLFSFILQIVKMVVEKHFLLGN